MVVREFFVNFCVLFTGIFLIHFYFRRHKTLLGTARGNILGGVLQGGFGLLLMEFGIHITDGLLVDLRSIPLMLAAHRGGWASAWVTAAILIFGRLVLSPISTSFSVVNSAVYILSTVVFCFISHSSLKNKHKWILMAVAYLFIVCCFLHYLIPVWTKLFIILVQFTVAIVIATATTYLLTTYLWQSQKNYEMFKELSQKDYLTGLNNVRSFDDIIRSSYEKAMEHQEELSLLMIDIDHFKHVNDTYGHPVGDEVLKQLGQILKTCCRSVDIVSRNGGEEFSVVLPTCDTEAAKTLAKRICETVEQHVFVINDYVLLKLTVSIGFSTANNKSNSSVSRLIQLADEGLYTAKRLGRNRVCHSPHPESHTM